ncbi:MAG: DMT family transporter [Gammaproteobacteria bacterium]|nr:DMT family transporter [Gammaproteobacteria bacterium]
METQSPTLNSVINNDYYRHLFGVICKILALSGFCILSLSFENPESYKMDSITQLGFLSLLGSGLLLPFVWIFFKKQLRSANLKLYPLRAVLTIIAMLAWIEAVKAFGSTNAILVNYLSPLVTLTLASLFKAERINSNCIFLGLICYSIIAFTLRVEIAISSYGFIVAIISTILWSTYEVICKQQVHTEHYVVQAFYTFLFAGLFLLPFYYQNIPNLINSDNLISFAGMSILRIFNVLLLFLAIQVSTLNWLAPVSYLKFGLIAYWSYMLQGTVPKTEHIITVILLVTINIIALRLRLKARTSS